MIAPLPVNELTFSGLTRPNQLLSGTLDVEYSLRLARAVAVETSGDSIDFFYHGSVHFCY
jgi:hypothetical protein